jgi:DNA-directed RNA polymerase specialized sigma24 family protein
VTTPTPWWDNDPEIAEIRRRTAEEFGIVLDATEPGEAGSPEGDDDDDFDDSYSAVPAKHDPVMAELLDGHSLRRLSEARDALIGAREGYDDAVLEARTAGYSWGEIGTVLGVSKQQLHRRFGARQWGRR